MTMARIATIFSVIFSLFLLSHARLPDGGGGASSSFSLAVVGTEESNDRESITLPLEGSSDASTTAVDNSRHVALSLRRPIKLRCRHTRTGRSFAIPLPIAGRHHARVIPFGDDMIGFSKGIRIPHGDGAVGLTKRSRIPRGFAGKKRRFPTRTAGFDGGVERMPIGVVVESDDRRIWTAEVDREQRKREKKMDGGFRKRLRNHRKEGEEDGFKEWIHKQKKSLKKRFWEFLNRF